MLRINEILVIPIADDFNVNSALAEYKVAPKPKEEFAKWLVAVGYVRNAPVLPVDKRKVRAAALKEL